MSSKKLKVVLLGEGKVGKTAIIMRYCMGAIPGQRQQTVNASCQEKKLVVSNKEVVLSIWDTAGQEIFNAIAPMYYRDADGAVLVYDITIKESFDKVNYWLSQLKKFAPKDIVIQIVGNKIDKENERKIPKDQVVKFCEQNGALYEETSAKEDIGVSQMFRNLAMGKLFSSRNHENLLIQKW
jgi:Ras-related protein Rab-21